MGSDPEKAGSGSEAEYVDNVAKVQSGTEREAVDVDEEFSYVEQRKIVHRIDRRLVTVLGIGYTISLIDRTNTSMAVIAGMDVALGLKVGFRYSTAVLLFFVSYIIFQPFATAVIRRLGPRKFISTIILTWGAVMVGSGFINTWQQLAGLRVLLGALEAGFFPGAVYLLSCWYSRYEIQKRYALFYFIGAVAGSLSGILAFGLMQMNGMHGLGGWRWIYIMEGVITFAIAIISFIGLVDFPEKGHKAFKFLTQNECAFVIRRLNRDRGDADPESFDLKKFLRPALDPKIWGFAMIFFCLTTVTYAIAYFLPMILTYGMGYSVGVSQCLVAPPYFFAAILMFASSWFGDRYRMRAPVLGFLAVVTLVGLPLMGFAKGNAARYVGVFLTTAGANSAIPAAMAYQANNIRGQWTRAFASATLVGFGGIGGIAGSLVFRSQDAPAYIPGIWAAIASQLLLIIILILMSTWFWYCNRKADRGEKVIEGSETFRYTI